MKTTTSSTKTLSHDEQIVLHASVFGLSCFRFRKGVLDNQWTAGVKREEIRDAILNNFVRIFRDGNEYQIVVYYRTPSGLPSESRRYRIPVLK